MVPLLTKDEAEIQTGQGLHGEGRGHEERHREKGRERKVLPADYGYFGRDRTN